MNGRISLSPSSPVKSLYLEACRLGNVELVTTMLSEGADVNWREHGGFLRSGLHLVIEFGHGVMVDLLLSQPGIQYQPAKGRLLLLFKCKVIELSPSPLNGIGRLF